MSTGQLVQWAHYDIPDIGTIKEIRGAHILVQWPNQPPRWTVEWRLRTARLFGQRAERSGRR